MKIILSVLISLALSAGAWFGIIKPQQNLGVEIPSTVALFETSLASKITSSATSMTLVSGTMKNGSTLNGKYGFIIDESGADEEFVLADCVDTACTNMLRGIDVADGKTEVSALKKEHRRGASVKMTDFPILVNLQRLASGSEAFEDLIYYAETIGTTGFGTTASSSNLATKYYVDYVGAGGFTSLNVNTSDGLQVYGTSPETLGINLASTSGLYFDSGGNLAIYASTSNPLYIDDDGQVSLNSSASYAFGLLTLETPLAIAYGGMATTSFPAGSIPYMSSVSTAFDIVASGTEDYLLGISGGFPAWLNNAKYQNVLYSSGTTWTASVASSSSDNEMQNVASISIPANTLGTNGYLKVNVFAIHATETCDAGIQVKFGETALATLSFTSETSYISGEFILRNNGVTSSQSGYYRYNYNNVVTEIINPQLSTSVDTSIEQQIEILYNPCGSGQGTIRHISVEPYYY